MWLRRLIIFLGSIVLLAGLLSCAFMNPIDTNTMTTSLPPVINGLTYYPDIPYIYPGGTIQITADVMDPDDNNLKYFFYVSDNASVFYNVNDSYAIVSASSLITNSSSVIEITLIVYDDDGNAATRVETMTVYQPIEGGYITNQNLYISGMMHIKNELQVSNGTVTICPGSDISFADGARLVINNGSLICVGDDDWPIALSIDASGGQWGGIVLTNTITKLNMRKTVISKAYIGFDYRNATISSFDIYTNNIFNCEYVAVYGNGNGDLLNNLFWNNNYYYYDTNRIYEITTNVNDGWQYSNVGNFLLRDLKVDF